MPKTNRGSQPYVYVTYINTTPRALWRALTDRDFIRQYWMGRQNTSTWRRGAKIESRSPEGELEWHGKILESDPPRRLVYTFQGAGPRRPVTRATFEIEPMAKNSPYRGRGVRLTVTHAGFRFGGSDYKGIAGGWPAILSGLKSLLETGRGLGIRYLERS